MEIKFEQKLSREDWLEFNKIYVRKINQKRIYFILFVAVICLLQVVHSVSEIFRFFEENSVYFPHVGISEVIEYTSFLFYKGLLFFFFSAALFWRYFWETNLKLKRIVDNPDNKWWLLDKCIMISETKIEIVSDIGLSAFKWEMIAKVLETKNYMAMFSGSATTILIAKRDLTESQLDQLKQLIHEKTSVPYDLIDK